MNDERAHEMVEHLQAAALELIEAARAFLDVAEDVVKDPGQAVALASAAAKMAGAHGPPPDGAGPTARVEHIRVS
jgi:hypothetical protein